MVDMKLPWTKTLTDYSSFKRLQTLAESAYDLRRLPEEIDRVESFSMEAEGWSYLYPTERVTEEVMEGLYALAGEAKALEKMEAMQRGEVINRIEGYPSEERSVLHTAMRALYSNEPAALAAKEEIEKLRSFLKERGHFTDLVTVAIGGSDLGPRALFEALSFLKKEGKRAHFISNVDPDDTGEALRGLNLSKTLIAIVSKSGTTLETLVNEELVREALKRAGLDPLEHLVAITQKGSPMDDPSRYLACFHLFDYVGGRYSATAAPGALLLSFTLGLEVYLELLKGAEAMDQHALRAPARENLPLTLALLGIWNRNFLKLPSVALIPYAEPLSRFPAHVQQLDMESNGKRTDRKGRSLHFETGPLIFGEPGTNAQHSFFQWIHQGTDAVPLEFITFRQNQYPEDLKVQGTTSREKLFANVIAQMVALASGEEDALPHRACPGNRPSSLLIGERLDPYTMGSLFALYEHRVAFQGFIWGINSFDQEGVQLGKRLANRVLERIGKRGVPFPLADRIIEKAKWRT